VSNHSVNNGNKEYIRGDVHSNTAEGFFSLLKCGITGVYHHVGRGHLGRYCDEFSFRHEHRQVSDGHARREARRGRGRQTVDVPALIMWGRMARAA
jgi:hypothetical protein